MNNLPPPAHISVLSEIFPPKPTWTTDQVPDQTGKVIIVTGGNAGIGKETCRVLLSRNARVYLAARSESKANEAIKELKEKTGKSEVFFIKLDLADLNSVRRAAEEFLGKEQQLHILFNNGGVMSPPLDVMTAQDYDGQFGTNVLGHFFFTKLLMPAILRTAQASPAGTVRIINTSSSTHELYAVSGGIVWESLEKGQASYAARKKIGSRRLYGQSKLGNVLISNELAKRYGSQGIVSISLHPGGVKTELQRHGSGAVACIGQALLYDISLGAITQLYAGTTEEAARMNGEYLTCWARRKSPSKYARDPEMMTKLWDWCEEQVKGF